MEGGALLLYLAMDEVFYRVPMYTRPLQYAAVSLYQLEHELRRYSSED